MLVMISSIPTVIAVDEEPKINIGDCITLGKYLGEPIVWRCVDIDDNGPLMLSEKILCIKAYDVAGEDSAYHNDGWGDIRKQYGSSCWEDSNLRQWLNSSEESVEWTHCPPSPDKAAYGMNGYESESGFLTNFTDEEKNMMKTVTNTVNVNIWESKREGYCDGGTSDTIAKQITNPELECKTYYYKDIVDTMFVLSASQYNSIYCNNPQFLKAYPTESAVENSKYVDDSLSVDQSYCYWTNIPWGNNYACYEHVYYVNQEGAIAYRSAFHDYIGVRPAFYLADGQISVNDNIVIPGDNACEYNNHYYKLFDISMTWEEAKLYCEDIGGYLATVTSKEEQDVIEKLANNSVKEHLWVGAKRNLNDEFEWITGEKFEFHNWSYGEPNDLRNSEDWLMLYTQNSNFGHGKWNDTLNNGDSSNPIEMWGFICEWEDVVDELPKWKNLYIDYIENELLSDYCMYDGYDIIYLDDDNIPEIMLLGSSSPLHGSALLWISNEKVNMMEQPRFGERLYIEREGEFRTYSIGNGIHTYSIYSFDSKELNETHKGTAIYHEDAQTETDRFSYNWDGETVSQEEFINKLEEAFNVSKATKASYNQPITDLPDAIKLFVEEDNAPHNIKVYSSYPNSEIGVEQEVKLFVELYENDTLINSENGYSIVNSNSSVVKVIETKQSNDGYFFTLKGLSEGSTDFTIIDSITNTSTTIPINVVDKSEFYRCSVSFDCLNVNDIYITDYSCVVNDYGNHNITFNAYNWSYSYGVVEVYDSNGKIIKVEPINPRNDGSGTEKIVNGFRYVAIDLSSDKEWYKKDSNTKHTPIELANIPIDSKIVVTTDPKVSGIASLYTGVDVFTKVVLAASTLNIKTDAQQATVKALLTEALKSLPESALKSLSSELSKSMTAGATSESVSKIYEIVFNMFESIGLDFGSIIKSTLMGMGYGAVDSVVTTLIPATQVVFIVDDVLAIMYPIVDYSYSIDKGKAEIYITKHGLQNYLTNNSVTITQNSDFGKETILDAYIVVEESELQRLPDSIAGDLVYYNIYNITLRENNKEVQPNEEIEVRIPIPPNADGRKCVVYRIEDNGERTYLPARIDDGYLVFNTTHLSYYVVGQKTYEYGDVNKDGNLNIKDATAIQKYLASLIDFDEEAISVADYNKDTKITIKDATAIQKRLAGLI